MGPSIVNNKGSYIIRWFLVRHTVIKPGDDRTAIGYIRYDR